MVEETIQTPAMGFRDAIVLLQEHKFYVTTESHNGVMTFGLLGKEVPEHEVINQIESGNWDYVTKNKLYTALYTLLEQSGINVVEKLKKLKADCAELTKTTQAIGRLLNGHMLNTDPESVWNNVTNLHVGKRITLTLEVKDPFLTDDIFRSLYSRDGFLVAGCQVVEMGIKDNSSSLKAIAQVMECLLEANRTTLTGDDIKQYLINNLPNRPIY